MSSYKNTFWYSFLTVSTVGYGEIVTLSLLGRIATALLSLISMIINSFLIVAFTNLFE